MFEKKFNAKDLYVAKVTRLKDLQFYRDTIKLYYGIDVKLKDHFELYVIAYKNEDKIYSCTSETNYPIVNAQNCDFPSNKLCVEDKNMIPFLDFYKEVLNKIIKSNKNPQKAKIKSTTVAILQGKLNDMYNRKAQREQQDIIWEREL